MPYRNLGTLIVIANPGIELLPVGAHTPVGGIVEQIDGVLDQDDRNRREHQTKRICDRLPPARCLHCRDPGLSKTGAQASAGVARLARKPSRASRNQTAC